MKFTRQANDVKQALHGRQPMGLFLFFAFIYFLLYQILFLSLY